MHNDRFSNKLGLALMVSIVLPACSWVDSTGRTTNTAPKILLDSQTALIDERGTLQVPVFDDSGASIVFSLLPSDSNTADACNDWFPLEATTIELKNACVNTDNCKMHFDTDPSDSNLYLISAPEVRNPVALQYLISAEDIDGETDEQVLNMCIRPINDAPVTRVDNYLVEYKQALNISGVVFDENCEIDSGQSVLDNDSDDRDYRSTAALSGRCISAKLQTAPTAHSGGFTLEANGGFNYISDGSLAPGQSDSFSYTADDGDQESSATLVTIQIIGDNSSPTLNDTTPFDVAQGGRITLNADELATDPEGFTLKVVALSDPSHGSNAIVDNGLMYEPDSGYSGADQFTAVISDPAGATITATIDINVNADNFPPEIIGLGNVEQNYDNAPSIVDPIEVNFRVTDLETLNESLRVSVVSSAETVVTVQQVSALDSSGRGTFTLQPLTNGEATITFSVRDDAANALPANTVSQPFKVSISGMRSSADNTTPRARNDRFTMLGGETKQFDVTVNDTDADGDTLSYRITDFGQLDARASISSSGQLNIEAPFVFRRTYFWVKIEADDGYGGVDTSTARIQVDWF